MASLKHMALRVCISYLGSRCVQTPDRNSCRYKGLSWLLVSKGFQPTVMGRHAGKKAPSMPQEHKAVRLTREHRMEAKTRYPQNLPSSTQSERPTSPADPHAQAFEAATTSLGAKQQNQQAWGTFQIQTIARSVSCTLTECFNPNNLWN